MDTSIKCPPSESSITAQPVQKNIDDSYGASQAVQLLQFPTRCAICAVMALLYNLVIS